MVTEIVRTYDADVAQPGDALWNEAVSEWTMGAEIKLKGQLRMARAAAMVERRHGHASLEAFGDEVGAGRSMVYDYANLWRRLLAAFETPERISERLDGSPLTITNVIEAAKEEDIPRALDEAEDHGLSSRAQRARRRERSEAPEEGQKVHLITHVICPACQVASPLNECETTEIEA